MLKASMNYMEVIELHSKLDSIATEVEKKRFRHIRERVKKKRGDD